MKPKTPRRAALLACLALLAAGALSGCLSAQNPDAPAAEPRAALTITSAPVQQTRWPQTLQVQGAVAAWQEAQVSAGISGLALSHIAVNVGDRVKRGQLLARFDDRSVRADVAAAQASLSQARANARQAAVNRDRTLALQDSGAISDEVLQQAVTQAETAAAQAQLAQAQWTAQQVRLANCEVRAVDAGVISARSATLGQVAQAGTELFRLIRQERLEWRAELNATQLAQVAVGQQAELRLPDGRTVSGTVRQLAPALDPVSRLGLVYVDLPAGSAARAGLFASGHIAVGQSPALTVPPEAVVLRDGRTSVFRLDGDAVAQMSVTTGRRQPGAIELIDGLQGSERVAVRGAGFLNDGDRVRDVATAETRP